MLQFGSLCLESIVIILEHTDQFLVVIDLVTVQKLDLCSVDAIIGGNSGKSPQGFVLSHEVLNLILKVVNLPFQFNFLLFSLSYDVLSFIHLARTFFVFKSFQSTSMS